MEDLLRAITSNPILLFLIIGAILSFLQRKEEPQDDKKKKPGQNPQRKQTSKEQRPEIDWREIFRQEEKTAPPTPKRTVQKETPSYTYVEEKVEDSRETYGQIVKRQQEEARKKKEMADRMLKKSQQKQPQSPIYKDDITKTDRVSLDFSHISKEEIVKGVVWSEVLGKPRAKGSYRAGRLPIRKQG